MSKCANCGGDEGLHHYQTMQCPVGGREAPLGKRQEYMDCRFQKDNEPKDRYSTIRKFLKENLNIVVDTEVNPYTDQKIIVVSLMLEGEEIDSDKVTL